MKEITKLRRPAERVVESNDVKNVIGDVKSRVNEIIPKKQLDFEKALVQDIAKLGDKERLEAANFYLKKELSPKQQQAILKAHNVGLNREGAGIYNYNQAEISQKVKILKDAGFSKEERKILLEKGVCGKNVNTDVLDAEFISNRMKLSDFEKLSIDKKLDVLGIPREFYDLVNDSGFVQEGVDLIERYKKLQYGDIFLKMKTPVDYQKMINNALESLKNYGIDRTDAMLLFASTDKYLFGNINSALRGTKNLTEKQKAFINRFDQALEKMPDLEGNHVIRGDSHYSWLSQKEIEINGEKVTNLQIVELIKNGEIVGLKKADKMTLDAYTYVANKKDDVFLGKYFPKNDTLIIVKGGNTGIKDISALSLYKNFGDRLPGGGKTQVEGIIQRGTEVKFIDSRVFQNAIFNDGTLNRKIVVVRVKNK